MGKPITSPSLSEIAAMHAKVWRGVADEIERNKDWTRLEHSLHAIAEVIAAAYLKAEVDPLP